ncbi:Mrp/NBP35 family ATP-binding protein [Methanocella sp. MCL-LM]|uniref:Mrp/NBP35 family ATP-binding protein n=1 Tax=Methanocella sp. MCL-LM TaxID=3412035 RepID=UPI003C709124
MSDTGAEQCSSCQSKNSAACDTCSSKGNTGQTEQQVKISKNLGAIRHRIAIVSGKGGVGKSTVTAGIAYNLAKSGFKVGILDADVSGPNIPHLLNVEAEKMQVSQEGLLPVVAAYGIKIASAESLIESSDTPIVWRGPMRSSLINQFLADMQWGELDFLLVDLPPGTGDEPLSIMQTIPLTGLVIVSTPSSLSILDVSKIINMAKTMNVRVLGLVENMAYYECPGCREKVYPFGDGKVRELAGKYDLSFLGQLPLDPMNSGKDVIVSDESPAARMAEEITGKILKSL